MTEDEWSYKDAHFVGYARVVGDIPDEKMARLLGRHWSEVAKRYPIGEADCVKATGFKGELILGWKALAPKEVVIDWYSDEMQAIWEDVKTW